MKQLEVEIQKNMFLAQQAKKEWSEIENINNSQLAGIGDWRNEMLRKQKEQKPQKDFNFYTSNIHSLNTIRKQLTEWKHLYE